MHIFYILVAVCLLLIPIKLQAQFLSQVYENPHHTITCGLGFSSLKNKGNNPLIASPN